MKILGALAVAGVALGAAAGFSGGAAAAGSAPHVLTVALPGGGVETIYYAGDVAPRVTFSTGAPAFGDVAARVAPFAELDRISAMMDREAAIMLREAAAIA